jgi:Transmembrane exosortase (Exosortase_EpsH)
VTSVQVMDSHLRGGDEVTVAPLAWKQSLLQLAIVAAVILALFWRDAADMAAIWWNSSTFNHCLIILPVMWWLVDQRKSELAKLTPQGWVPALLWVGAGGLGGLLGDAAGVALARHLGLVMMLQGAVATILCAGWPSRFSMPFFWCHSARNLFQLCRR